MWKLIKIYFNDEAILSSKGFDTSLLVESVLKPSHLYFAHYSRHFVLQIIIQTDLESSSIVNLVKDKLMIAKDVQVTDGNSPGSVIHSLAYQICKFLKDEEKKKTVSELEDLFHWMHNMLGFSYSEEGDNYKRWADNSYKHAQS